MGRNGVAGTQGYNQCFCVRYTKNGGHAATRFRSCVESIPAWHQRLRAVTILNRDAMVDLIPQIEDAAGTVIYVDPPYLVKGARYVHDFDGIAHHHLATALNRFEQTRVIVSYYEHPKLSELYPGPRWTKINCPTTKSMVSSGQRGQTGQVQIAPEVLLINGPSYPAPGGN
jgi:DNA adenine methylase